MCAVVTSEVRTHGLATSSGRPVILSVIDWCYRIRIWWHTLTRLNGRGDREHAIPRDGPTIVNRGVKYPRLTNTLQTTVQGRHGCFPLRGRLNFTAHWAVYDRTHGLYEGYLLCHGHERPYDDLWNLVSRHRCSSMLNLPFQKLRGIGVGCADVIVF